jgi:GNAT superfamily N-acetyltransferase
MFGRCSCETRYRRFHSPVRAIPERYLAGALAGRPDHYALAATAPDGAITALASCCTVFPGTVLPGTVFPGTAELGLLVEDASQGLGLGSFLLQELVRYSERAGHTVLTATILREQAWIIRLLRAYGTCATAPAHEALVVTVHLPDSPPHMRDTRPSMPEGH